MIVDCLENWKNYIDNENLKLIFDFLINLKPNAEEKEYLLKGKDIYANIRSYNTRMRKEAVLESHLNYVDIQTTLSGAEIIAWYPLKELKIKTPYNPEKDVVYYNHPPHRSPARVEILPNIFVLLFPEDGHMPQLMVEGKSSPVKKVVVKIKRELVE